MPLTIFFSAPGTYTIDDDGIRGNNTSVVRDANGNILFPFTHPADTISFIAEVPGINFVFNTADSFGTANVVVGSLTNSAVSPDNIIVKSLRTDGTVTLTANATITEGGSDAAADIISPVLVLVGLVDTAQDDGGTGGLGILLGAMTVATTIRLTGGLDRDTLTGSAANDLLYGLGGNDTLRGNGGNDTSTAVRASTR